MKKTIRTEGKISIDDTCLYDDNFLHSLYAHKYGNKIPTLHIANRKHIKQAHYAILFYDASTEGKFVHWFVYNIHIPELPDTVDNKFFQDHSYPTFRNDFGNPGYGGPEPPSGIHHYVLQPIKYMDEITEDEVSGAMHIHQASTYDRVMSLFKNRENEEFIESTEILYDSKNKGE